jgi:cytochrome c
MNCCGPWSDRAPVARRRRFRYDFQLRTIPITDSGALMKVVAVLTAAAALLGAGAAHAVLDNAAAEALMKKDGCAVCHAVDKKIIGPSYQDVAAKYRGDKDALANLSKKVKEGGSGVWPGGIPMPPNAAVKEADIKELVTWILSLKK